MARVENINDITEVVQKINLDDIETLYSIKREGEIPYSSNRHYYIVYDTEENGKIVNLIGIPVTAESFAVPYPDKYHVAYLPDLTENQYYAIKNSFFSKDILVFYDEENDELFYRRIWVEVTQGYFDPNKQAFWADDDKVKLKVFVKDSNEDPDDDIQNIQLKILRRGGDMYPVSNVKIIDAEDETTGAEDTDGIIKVNDRKYIIKNGTEVTFDLTQLEKDEISIVRIKATLEHIDVKRWWLTAYLRFINPHKQ